MKKIILSLLISFLATGCVNINNASIDKLISTALNSKYSLINEYSKGYKYYLPRDLHTKKQNNFNEIISSKNHDYYLYVDLISYNKKSKLNYKIDETLYYSELIEKDGKKGILNIDCNELDECVVKLTYNYAIIQTKTKKDKLNEVIDNSIVITSTIKYNDNIVEEIIKEAKYSSSEEQVNVFNNNNKNDSEYLGEIDDEEEYEDKVIDPDFIR